MDNIQTIRTWSHEHQGETIQIHKQEGTDIDVIIMNLDQVIYAPLDPNDLDSYLPQSAIYLHGTGTIDTDYQLLQSELPKDIYVVPIEGIPNVAINGSVLHIQTERAHYKLTSLHR
ncbi:hypothetical protein [Longirhabdus pacifica]|uniref:hypothetical protein n=1 Tax=Longirhabdus pacifica TaxID=2305227 RepID=UPI00100921C5|nr:hypothetical protein [Longirhabdus pacifica]